MRTYKTKQREAVLSLFEREPDRCFSARDVLLLCQGVGQATVYRALARLTEEGQIKRFLGVSGVDFYKLSVTHSDESHIHMVCKTCGDVIHSDCDFIRQMSHHLKSEHSFTLDTGSTVIYGYCEGCSKEAHR